MYENSNWAFENAEKASVAIRLLRDRTAMLPERDRGFASSLVENFQKKKSLSVKQWDWVKKLSEKLENPATPKLATERFDNLQKLNDLFDTAKENGLKTPKLKFLIGEDEVKLGVAGPASRFPGQINIVVNDEWLGRIDRAGVVTHGSFGRALDEEIVKGIQEFAEHPLESAVAYGRRTGSCCLCGRELTNSESIALGIGPICAGNWGLG